MISDSFYFSHDLDRLVDQLQFLYKDIAAGINGNILEWSPTVSGTTDAGTATYSHQDGWIYRRGLVVQLWMDVSWSAGTGTGDLAIDLPNKVAKSSFHPFLGVVENVSDDISFTGGYTYLTWSAFSDSFNGIIRECGSGVDSLALSYQAAGRLIGSMTYIGQENE